jgi:hypothetical protein
MKIAQMRYFKYAATKERGNDNSNAKARNLCALLSLRLFKLSFSSSKMNKGNPPGQKSVPQEVYSF